MFIKKRFASLESSANNLYELNDEEIERLHEVILEMYKDVNAVCLKHNIHMIAAGGTALGAIRHKGFIPWDDDMDIFMLRSEYEKFEKLFEKELGHSYYLLAPGYKKGANCFLPRIMKKGTTLLNMIDEASPYPHGIYIDINLIEYAPENNMIFNLKAVGSDLLRLISYSVYWNQYRSKSLEEFMLNSEGVSYYKIRILIGKIFSFYSSEKWFSIFNDFVKEKETKKLTVPSGTKKYRGEVLNKDEIFPLKLVNFEDTNILVFNNHHEYLTNLYGDYMVIPKGKKREHHLCLKLDFEKEC